MKRLSDFTSDRKKHLKQAFYHSLNLAEESRYHLVVRREEMGLKCSEDVGKIPSAQNT